MIYVPSDQVWRFSGQVVGTANVSCFWYNNEARGHGALPPSQGIHHGGEAKALTTADPDTTKESPPPAPSKFTVFWSIYVAGAESALGKNNNP